MTCELPDDLQAYFLSRMDAAEVATITEGLEDDDIADILQQLPDRITREDPPAEALKALLRE